MFLKLSDLHIENSFLNDLSTFKKYLETEKEHELGRDTEGKRETEREKTS